MKRSRLRGVCVRVCARARASRWRIRAAGERGFVRVWGCECGEGVCTCGYERGRGVWVGVGWAGACSLRLCGARIRVRATRIRVCDTRVYNTRIRVCATCGTRMRMWNTQMPVRCRHMRAWCTHMRVAYARVVLAYAYAGVIHACVCGTRICACSTHMCACCTRVRAPARPPHHRPLCRTYAAHTQYAVHRLLSRCAKYTHAHSRARAHAPPSIITAPPSIITPMPPQCDAPTWRTHPPRQECVLLRHITIIR